MTPLCQHVAWRRKKLTFLILCVTLIYFNNKKLKLFNNTNYVDINVCKLGTYYYICMEVTQRTIRLVCCKYHDMCYVPVI